MNMKTKILLLAFVSLMMAACSGDEPSDSTIAKVSEAADSRYISSDEALLAAIKGFEDFGFSSNISRTGENADIYIYMNEKSRNSEVKDSLFYVVNMEDGGFAVVTAPRELGAQIVGLSEKGRFDEDNDNLSYYMGYMGRIYSILPFKPGDGPIGSIDIVGGDPKPDPETSFIDTYERLLPTMWAQEYPYNMYCPELSNSDQTMLSEHDLYILGGNTAAGCVPVAIGQIAAFHKKPASINGYTLDWSRMLNNEKIDYLETSAQCQVGHLLRELGREMNVDYGITSFAKYLDAYWGCRTNGFDNVTMTDNIQDCFDNILNEGPVAVFGTDYYEVNGHCWVADGYKKVTYKKWVESKNDYEITRVKHMLHFNWGWGGNCDGYFDTSASFNTPEVEFDNNTLEFLINFK